VPHLPGRPAAGADHPMRRTGTPKGLGIAAAALLAGMSARGLAQTPAAAELEPEPINDSEGYTPPSQAPPSFSINGYVDVGFAKAQGNGTSFAPYDESVPADYGVDTFAPAVNSRGDVASINSNGRFVNGFLPRSVGIGGNASLLVNTLDIALNY